jgi:hypothetical protein
MNNEADAVSWEVLEVVALSRCGAFARSTESAVHVQVFETRHRNCDFEDKQRFRWDDALVE